MNQLDVLASHRNNILLAEAIGWLHDYRKCSDEQLKAQAANLRGQQALPRNSLANNNKHSDLTNVNFQLPVQSTPLTITELLDNNTWNNNLLGQFLSRCHNTAHFDKQDLEKDYGKQNYPAAPNDPKVQLSSPFGFEVDIPINLTQNLWKLPWGKLANYSSIERQKLQDAIVDLFKKTVADTRRPINEVDLWGWGLLVGALYKSALAGALLIGSSPAARDLRWRLLGIRVNGLDYFLNVARIPDLLARQELLTDGLNKVRDLLEITYPLGSEVYRDENGSVYIVPDMFDLLERTDNSGASLRTLILQVFAQGTVKGKSNLQLGGEMVPHLKLEQQSWWGQDPDREEKTQLDKRTNQPKDPQLYGQKLNDELPTITDFLMQDIRSSADPSRIITFWQSRQADDICTVCGLRPQGLGTKAAERNVCDICEQRRADRSQQWATSQPDRTIWTDEVADANGRLALIVGQFDLTHWLDGSFLESLLLIAPRDPQNTNGKPVTSKTPSFSRLRRIWETTHAFWREVQAESLKQLSDDRRRLKIHLDAKPNLGPFHVYDLVVEQTALSVVWVPSQNNNDGYLITADNLGYIARQLGAETGVYTDPATAAIFVEDYLGKQFMENARQLILCNPDASTGQGRANLIEGIGIAKVNYQENHYATAIPILAEPRSFMIIVPSDKSLEVLKLIKEKYEQEIGKVRDRLPLHLGCIYAHRRTPIRAVLDAGRAMLEIKTLSQEWRIKSTNGQTQTDADNLKLELDRNGHHIQWYIQQKMGDGNTEDRWYPYCFLKTEGNDSKANEHNRRAVKVSKPTNGGQMLDCWIVHAADLHAGETIYLWPSTFDFEFLDTTARRFEIHYDENGHRPRRTRPFYLEDLDRLEELWGYMARLTKAQRHQVIRTIEATRETWYGQDNDGEAATDKVFQQFVADTLASAEWQWKDIPEARQKELIQAGVRGEMADLAELHMEILKE